MTGLVFTAQPAYGKGTLTWDQTWSLFILSVSSRTGKDNGAIFLLDIKHVNSAYETLIISRGYSQNTETPLSFVILICREHLFKLKLNFPWLQNLLWTLFITLDNLGIHLTEKMLQIFKIMFVLGFGVSILSIHPSIICLSLWGSLWGEKLVFEPRTTSCFEGESKFLNFQFIWCQVNWNISVDSLWLVDF